MIKHRLMLSAAAAVLLASPIAAQGQTTIDTATTDQVLTSVKGNVTISPTGSIALRSTGAALVINSNNFATNNGIISNINTTGAIGVLIDTSAQVIVAQSPGLLSTNTISLAGTGDNKVAVMISGANPYFGNITINNATPVSNSGAGATIIVEGDSSAAFRLMFGSRVDGDITFGGSITGLPTSGSTSATASSLFLFDGQTNGNIYFDSSSAISNAGNGARGIAVLGEVKACANTANSAAQMAAGFTCVTDNGKGSGSLINAGRIVVVGQVSIDPASKEPLLEGGSVMQIGNSIQGGFYQSGPATANAGLPSGVLSGNGANNQAVLRIDPLLSATSGIVRGPINIGVLPSGVDPIDGDKWSILNRGTIVAQPTASQVSSNAVFIQGASTSAYTCLGNGDFATCGADGKGGILNTGAIRAFATTDTVTLVTSNVSATAISIGSNAVVPHLNVQAQSTGAGATPGIIQANVSGTSGGIANALFIGSGAKLPLLTIGAGATIEATVTTSTVNPTIAVATSTAPFTLVATTIVDQSGTLATINNSGTINASVTDISPALDAVVVTSVRAIDLSASTANGIVINNSGTITGNMLYGSGGNNYALNVGNTGTGGAANLGTGTLNTPNNYAVVAGTVIARPAGAAPSTSANVIDYGAGTGHSLTIGSFGYVNSVIRASASSGVAVTVENNGTLFVANSTSTGSLNASTFNIQSGGTLGLTVTQNTTATSPVINAITSASIAANSTVALQFGSFISSANVFAPVTQDIVLISAPTINIATTTLAQNNLKLSENLPFLFEASTTPLRLGTAGGNQTLLLALTPRTPGPGTGTTDATAGLGLTGDAFAQFPYIVRALATDPSLGSTIATSMTVYNNPGVASSKINVAASQQQAQQAFTQFGPDTSGGAKQVAIMITDQATGPVAARQRLLRSYSKVPGEMTLWAQEFFGNINNKGRVSADGSLTNYKDHGFGFTLGMDSGSPRGGWFGGAFTFYSGDVSQTLPRATQTQTQWYMLSGYSHWKGRRLFVDTTLSVAYGDFVGRRDLSVGGVTRRAEGKRATLMGALGGKIGAAYGTRAFEFSPYLSLDGMTMREEGYTEFGGGPGFNLQVAPYYANSLRTALGVDLKTSMTLWGVNLTPEARFGYRYDLVNSPVKLRAGFVSTGGTTTAGNSYNFVGPDPDTGNMFGGLGLGAGTDSWQLGVNFDIVRGNNGSTTQVGTISLLGRI